MVEPLLNGTATSPHMRDVGGSSPEYVVMSELPKDSCIEPQHLHETRASDPENVDDMIDTIDGSRTSLGSNENLSHTRFDFYDSSPIFEALYGVDDRESAENVAGITMSIGSHDKC